MLRRARFMAFLMACSLFYACGEDSPSPETPSNQNGLLALTLDVEGTPYTTTISAGELSNTTLFPYPTQQARIKSIQLSENATINVGEGDMLSLQDSPFELIVTAEDGTTATYTLQLKKDEGLQLQPNQAVEEGTSYTLQGSDVYVDPGQLLQIFGSTFFITAYADFDNDGHTDVLLSSGIWQSYEYSPLYLFQGDGTGVNADFCECAGVCSNYSCDSFTELSDAFPANYEGMQHPRKILIGDFNQDSRKDAFVIGHGYDAEPFPGESPILLLNNGQGFDFKKLRAQLGFYHGATSADFDQDGDLDIFTVGSQAEFLINDGTGSFYSTDALIDETLIHGAYYTAEAIDINQDGYIDLLIGGHEYDGADTYLLWGNSSGKFYKELGVILPKVAGFEIVVDIDAVDMDNDGDRDIILNRVDSDNFYENHYIQIIENKANELFTDESSSAISGNSGSNWYVWVHVQDVNNDNIPDLYLEDAVQTNKKFVGDGNGHFH